MRRVAVLAAGAFALGLDAYVMAGLLPGMARDLGASEAAVGQSVTAFTLAYAIAAPLFAAALGRARPRGLMVAALAVFTAGNALTAVAPGLGALIAVRAVAGAGAGLFSALSSAAAARLVPAERRGRALAVVMGGMSAGTVLGVPLGVLLAEQADWRATMWLVTALGAAVMAGTALLLPRLEPAGAAAPAERRAALLLDRAVAPVVGVSFLAAVASLGLYTYLAPVLADAGGVRSVVPHLWAWGLGGVAGSLVIGPLTDRFGRLRGTVGAIMAVLVLAQALVPAAAHLHPAAAALPLLLWGAVGWALQVPQQQRLLGIAGERRGGVAVALNNSALYLGSATGAALGGAALSAGVPAGVLPWAASGVAAAGLVLHLATARPRARLRAGAGAGVREGAREGAAETR
ncbi:MFS transporter [Nocardiopsis potens]|uniref:MFS transporter n=1 Tax=Nocardiopsis potens TaxID=1246458 RepID=UPI00034B80BC|nr:MFS transporter [Nocardiopsis potens]